LADEVYLTNEGYHKLSKELERLKFAERHKISKAIEEARLQGDLSENAEYDAAKDAQAHNEARISDLEGTLSNVRIIENENIPADKVYIGAIVSITDLDAKKKIKYMMVSPEESDFDQNKISIFSPIGKSLIGHAKGDEVEINVPDGTLHYKINKIERP